MRSRARYIRQPTGAVVAMLRGPGGDGKFCVVRPDLTVEFYPGHPPVNAYEVIATIVGAVERLGRAKS